MKKLISLLAAISVVSACSIGAFASEFTINGSETNKLTATDAATQTTYEKGDNGLYTVDLSSVAGDQDQTTILAVKGNNIAVGSIQYIGQSADKTFSFDLKDNLTEQVNVLAGGSKISPTLVGNMKPAQTQTGYTISGAVVDNSNLGEFMAQLEDPEAELDADTINYFKNNLTAKVYLLNYDETAMNLVNHVYGYLGEEGFEKPTPVAETTVDYTNNTYSFTDIAPGKYSLIIERQSALPLITYVDVTDSNVTVPTKSIIFGDNSLNCAVDIDDFNALVATFGSVFGESDNYAISDDMVANGAVDIDDFNLLVSTFGYDMTSYNEQAITDLFNAAE